ncbi:uncharacterized protein LOC112589839 [Harpegnathos saltator]|uniref:uncharacterized protein LOC112589839 n=1 Tax=Harpegnathos saltator TaxID=610380 RepID=UPI000DBED69A|nr:uncharacterized protein LOC112589839 [Harpegnathos saltator]
MHVSHSGENLGDFAGKSSSSPIHGCHLFSFRPKSPGETQNLRLSGSREKSPSHMILPSKAWHRGGTRGLISSIYSPNFILCDFALFPKVKGKLWGRRFETSEEVFATYNEEVSMVSKQEWNKIFNN